MAVVMYETNESSNISAIGFDKSNGELLVEFKSGKTYCYSGVPATEFKALLKAESKGKYFAANIKGQYEYTLVEAETEEEEVEEEEKPAKAKAKAKAKPAAKTAKPSKAKAEAKPKAKAKAKREASDMQSGVKGIRWHKPSERWLVTVTDQSGVSHYAYFAEDNLAKAKKAVKTMKAEYGVE